MNNSTRSILLCIPLFMAGTVSGQVFYVSPNGNDHAPGTIEKPFAHIEKAKQEVRHFMNTHPAKDITVYLRGGTYYIDSTIVFSPQDGAPEGRRITYKAYPGEVPVLSPARQVKGWKKASSVPFVKPGVQQQLWYADIGPGIAFKRLYQHGQPLKRAVSAGFMPLMGEKEGGNKTLHYPENVPVRNWPNAKDVEVRIRPTYAWTMNLLPVDAIDTVRHVIKTQKSGTYALNPQPAWSVEAHHITETCWLENAVDLIDGPGQWALDSREGKLWLWPAGNADTTGIAYPALSEMLLLDGLPADGEGSAACVKGLSFTGICFTGNDRYTWKEGERGFQHDWSAVDQASAAFRMRGAENCVVEGCTFQQLGTTAIRLDLHCQYNRIEGNRISFTGEHGIALCGYGPGTRDENRFNIVRNNRIDHCGREYWYGSGIYIAQSGENTVAHNLVHNIPFVGITLSGCRDFNYQQPRNGEGYYSVRWTDISPVHIEKMQEAYRQQQEKTGYFYPYLHARNNNILDNEIFSSVEVMGDGNAIYLSGAGTGNRIRGNYLHHIFSSGVQTAMRPDDLQEQTVFENNIIYKCSYGAVEHKHDNSYINNIFADIYPVNPRGQGWDEWAYFIFGRGPNVGTRIERNIFYDDTGNDCRFYYARPGSPLTDAVIDNNLYYSAPRPDVARRQLDERRKNGQDLHSMVADPCFNDPAKGDFSFKHGSAALKLGIVAPELKQAGLQPPWKARLTGDTGLYTGIFPLTGSVDRNTQTTIRIRSSDARAVIRFTTDGSEPDLSSPVYEGPVKLRGAGYIRAKSFLEGKEDIYGAAEFYYFR